MNVPDYRLKKLGGLNNVDQKNRTTVCRAGLREFLCGAETVGQSQWHRAKFDAQLVRATDRHSGTADRFGNSADGNNDAEPESARIWFAQRNSEHDGAGVNFAGYAHTREHDSAFDRKSEYPEHPRHFAQRIAVRDFAEYSERSAGDEWRRVESESCAFRERSRPQRNVAEQSGREPDAGASLPAGGFAGDSGASAVDECLEN
jgi:hypothetical protein